MNIQKLSSHELYWHHVSLDKLILPQDFYEKSPLCADLRTKKINSKKLIQSVSGRFLLAELLCYFNIREAELVFFSNKKPHWQNNHFSFSITHTNEMVACAISFDNMIGIDIEKISDKVLTTAPRISSQDEQNLYLESAKKATFLWTAKEAAYKCYGQDGIFWAEEINLNANQEQVVLRNYSMQLRFEEVGMEHILAFCIGTKM